MKISKEYEYVIKSDRDSGDETVFKLRPLSGYEVIILSGITSNAESFRYTFEKGVIGWRNLKDDTNRQIKYSGDVDKDIQLFDLNTLNDLTKEIASKSSLGEDGAKN